MNPGKKGFSRVSVAAALSLGALAVLDADFAGYERASAASGDIILAEPIRPAPLAVAKVAHLQECANSHGSVAASDLLFEKVSAAGERAAAARLESARKIRATHAARICGAVQRRY